MTTKEENKMDNLKELELRIDLMISDGSAKSMLELANIVKELIQEVRHFSHN